MISATGVSEKSFREGKQTACPNTVVVSTVQPPDRWLKRVWLLYTCYLLSSGICYRGGHCNRRKRICTCKSSLPRIEVKFNFPPLRVSAALSPLFDLSRLRGGNILSLLEWKVDRAKGERVAGDGAMGVKAGGGTEIE